MRSAAAPPDDGPGLGDVLGQGLALALEQIVASLGTLQFVLHQGQRLARGEDGLPRLSVVSAFCRMALGSFVGAGARELA